MVFGSADGVLIYEDGLKILTWPEAMRRIAPEVEAAKRSASLSNAKIGWTRSSAGSCRRGASSRR